MAVRMCGHPSTGGQGMKDGPVVSVLASKSAERRIGTPGGPEMVGVKGERGRLGPADRPQRPSAVAGVKKQLAWCREG